MKHYSNRDKKKIVANFEREYLSLIEEWAHENVSIPMGEINGLSREIIPKVNAICELAALNVTEEMKDALIAFLIEAWESIKTYKANLQGIADKWNIKVNHEYVDKCIVELAHILSDAHKWLNLGISIHKYHLIASRPILRDMLDTHKMVTFPSDPNEAKSFVFPRLRKLGYGISEVDGGFTLVSYNGVSL